MIFCQFFLHYFNYFTSLCRFSTQIQVYESVTLLPCSFFFFVTEQQARISHGISQDRRNHKSNPSLFLPEKDEHVFDFPYHGDSIIWIYNLYHFTPLFFLCFIWYDYLLCKACVWDFVHWYMWTQVFNNLTIVAILSHAVCLRFAIAPVNRWN